MVAQVGSAAAEVVMSQVEGQVLRQTLGGESGLETLVHWLAKPAKLKSSAT